MIRLAEESDVLRIVEIFDIARQFMRANGNMVQWVDGYPAADDVRADIEAGCSYVMEDDETGIVYATFALVSEVNPDYAAIYEGEWHSEDPYTTIHRIASDGTHHGVMGECVQFAKEHFDCLRVDTHETNIAMRKAIVKAGFEYCGIVYIVSDGTPRLAFDWKRS